MLPEFFGILLTGLSLGLLHAFDADHVMAVSTLSSQKPSLKRTIKFGAHWALGHGGVLLLCGVLLFGLSIQLPESLVSVAESSVGVLLIVIGVLCIQQCRRQNLKLVEHSHGDIKHTHWCLDEIEHQKKSEHTPIFVGMLHGLAGSAPALAIVPLYLPSLTQAGNEGTPQLFVSMAYLALFSIGVLISMTGFAIGLGAFQKKLKIIDARIFQGTRYLISSASILLGAYWLTS